MHYTAKLTKEKDGGYSVSFPDLDGCFTQGDTLDEALERAKEAMELTLEDVFDGHPLPEYRTRENRPRGLYRVDVSPSLATALQIAVIRGRVPQAVMARDMGMTPQAYMRLEDPKSNLSVKMLDRFAKAVGKRLVITFE